MAKTPNVLKQSLCEIYQKLSQSFDLESQLKATLTELNDLLVKNESQLGQYRAGHGLVHQVRKAEILLLEKSLEGNRLAVS